MRPRFAFIVLALVLSACSATNVSPGSTTTVAPIPTSVTAMGRRVETKNGNYVRVYAYQSPVKSAADKTIYVAADVEGCAGAHPAVKPRVNPATFFLEMSGRVGIHSVAPVKQPALVDTPLAPGHCARGWVTFHISENRQPLYVVFVGKDVVKWRIR
jgi:hypothetical protein